MIQYMFHNLMKMGSEKFYVFFISVFYLFKFVVAPAPGTFFWRPRLGLDLAIPTTEPTLNVHLAKKENIREGVVVLLEGYQAGIAVISLAAAIPESKHHMLHLNPTSAFFYTNVWRWFLRHFSLIPYWMGGNAGHYCKTLELYKRRFFFMDSFVPESLRHFFPWVPKESWNTEIQDFKKYKRFSEAAFGKHYRFPNKVFNNFASEQTAETKEGHQESLFSTDEERDL